MIRYRLSLFFGSFFLLFFQIPGYTQDDILSSGFLLVSASAEVEISAPPIDDLIQEALEKNPSILSMQKRILSTQERELPEGALPDPMVELMLQDVNFPSITVGDEEMSMVGVQVSQSFPYPKKLRSRKNAVRAEVNVTSSQLEELRRALIKNMRTLYARIYAVDREQQIIHYGEELQEMLDATVSMRYSTGQTEQENVLKTQLELSRLHARTIDLSAEREKVVAEINRLLNRSGQARMGIVSALPQITFPTSLFEESALDRSAEIQTRQQEILYAEQRLKAAEAELYPNFSVGVGAFSRGGFDQVVTIQFGVELPFWKTFKQKPLIRSAGYELEAAKADLVDSQAEVKSDLRKFRAESARINQQIHLLQEAILPQTSAALDAARSSYLTGRGDFSTVIEDFNLWLESRIQLERFISDRFITWAEIDSIVQSSIQNDNKESEP